MGDCPFAGFEQGTLVERGETFESVHGFVKLSYTAFLVGRHSCVSLSRESGGSGSEGWFGGNSALSVTGEGSEDEQAIGK